MHYNMFQQPPYYGTAWQNTMNWGNNPYHWQHNTDRQMQVQTEMEVNNKRGHTHAHYGATTCNDKHTHLHPGVTSTPIETEEGHVHIIYGNTTFDDNHIHYYEAYTSPPIELPNGYHTHYAEIRTSESDGHTHVIRGFTAPSKS